MRTQRVLAWKRKSLKEEEVIVYSTRPREGRTGIKDFEMFK